MEYSLDDYVKSHLMSDDENFQNLKKTFKDYAMNILGSNEKYDLMMKHSAHIINELENLSTKNKNGLLVGRVQSGKTLNFLSIIAQAYSKKYKIFIVLTSLDDKLEEQTFERLKVSFNYEKNKHFFNIYKAKNLKENEHKTLTNKFLQIIEQNGLIIITALKNSQISNLINIFDNENSDLFHERIFIIDDEGDLASVSYKKKSKLQEFETSDANKKISKLKSLNDKNIFLSVTATPQAQLYMEENVITELTPERIFTIPPGEGYYGLDYFCRNDNKIVVLDEFGDGEPNKHNWKTYIEEPLIYYILSSIEFKLTQKDNSKTNMLIHIDSKISNHESVKEVIEIYLEKWIRIFGDKSNSDYSFEETLKKFIYFSKKYDVCKNIFSDLERINDIKRIILSNLKKIVINVINQNEKNTEINKESLSIVIGSKMLERGITFNNLITTLFLNSPNTQWVIDTMLQRCRWFGYRKNEIKFMKIFTSKKIRDNFKETWIREEDTWNALKKKESEKSNFKNKDELAHIEITKIKPTNKVFISKESTFRNTYYDRFFYLDNTKDTFRVLKNKLKEQILDENTREHISASYNFYTKNISLNELLEIQEMLKHDLSISNEWNKIVDKLSNGNIKLIYMNSVANGKAILRERSFENISNGCYEINNLFQGKNDKYNDNEKNYLEYYIGDAYFCKIDKYNDTAFLQLHEVNCLDKSGKLLGTKIFLALLLPH